MTKIGELENAYTAVVADALDRLGLRAQALDPAIRPLAPGTRLAGQAVPVVVSASDEFPDPPYEDWIRLIEAIQPGQVVVLGVEEGVLGATWGELFSCAARAQGARGAISDGYVRDVSQIVDLGFPVFARGGSPLDTLGRASVASVTGETRCGGVVVRHGDYVLADADGAIVIPETAIDKVLAAVKDKARKEIGGREDLLAGVSVREVWDRYGVF